MIDTHAHKILVELLDGESHDPNLPHLNVAEATIRAKWRVVQIDGYGRVTCGMRFTFRTVPIWTHLEESQTFSAQKIHQKRSLLHTWYADTSLNARVLQLMILPEGV